MQKYTSKYINHTKEEIDKYLDLVKSNINNDNFIVCTTAKNIKNNDFLLEFRLSQNKQKQMLLELETSDFCYSADNYKNPQERLYIFCREYVLDNWGKLENVEVYIKIVVKKNNYVVVVSFHKPDKKIKKLSL